MTNGLAGAIPDVAVACELQSVTSIVVKEQYASAVISMQITCTKHGLRQCLRPEDCDCQLAPHLLPAANPWAMALPPS